MPATVKPHQNVIAERAVCLSLEQGRPGNRAKIDPRRAKARDINGEVQETELDGADMLHLSKDLLRSDELKAVAHLDGEIRGWVRARTLPSLFRDGVYLLLLELVEGVDQRLTQYQADRAALVERFLETYPQRVEEARQHLGANFDAVDYPPPSAIRHRFRVRWSYVEVGPPGNLTVISAELYQREREKAERGWAELGRMADALLLAELQQSVDHMIDRLSPGPDGKRKQFKRSLVPGFRETLDLIGARNVTGNDTLEAAVEKARELVEGVDTEYLRDWASARKDVCAGFERLKVEVDAAVVAVDRYVEVE